MVVLILTGLCVLRESGYINLRYSKSQFDNKMNVKLFSEFYKPYNGRQLPSSENIAVDNQQAIIVVVAWNLGYNTNPKTNVFISVEEGLRKTFADDERINVEVQNVELSGFYWLPFYKTGSCKYSFKVKIDGKQSRVYYGTTEGEIKFSTIGVTSVMEVKEKLREKIAADLLSTLKDAVR